MERSISQQVCPAKSKRVKSVPASKSLKLAGSRAGTKPSKSLFGTCCVCHNTPQHSRKYYGHLFCIKCFHKYIWSAPSGDAKSFSYEDLTEFADQIKQM